MHQIDRNETLSAIAPAGRKVYQTPELNLLGDVRLLTEGGSSGDMETNMNCLGMNIARVMC